MKIDGKLIAANILERLRKRVEKLKEKNIIPHLYIITFGQNDETESYLKQKLLRAEQIGAKITIKRFPVDVPVDEVYALIDKLNSDDSVNGIIVQRPLPESFDEEKISLAIVDKKDVDGFRPSSSFDPPVALAVVKAIEETDPGKNINDILSGKKVTIIGKGITAGKPTIKLLKKMNNAISVVDSKTQNRDEIIKNSDVIISAVGKKVINSEDLKNGAVLIGIGMHTVNGKLKGDYEESEIENIASFYTPTPGGIGPLNVTMLMKNLVEASEKQS